MEVSHLLLVGLYLNIAPALNVLSGGGMSLSAPECSCLKLGRRMGFRKNACANVVCTAKNIKIINMNVESMLANR